MELDPRHYGRYQLRDSALEVCRKHACLGVRQSAAQCEVAYAAASPLLEAAARHLMDAHGWSEAEPPTATALFCIRAPASDAVLTLPRTARALFEHAAPCERMFEALFDVRMRPDDGRLYVAEPLTDVFHLLQLLAPGCLALVKAEYHSHEVDDDGEVAWTTWRTAVRALPPAEWMDLHAPQLVNIFGQPRCAALRRAATDWEVLVGSDITFT